MMLYLMQHRFHQRVETHIRRERTRLESCPSRRSVLQRMSGTAIRAGSTSEFGCSQPVDVETDCSVRVLAEQTRYDRRGVFWNAAGWRCHVPPELPRGGGRNDLRRSQPHRTAVSSWRPIFPSWDQLRAGHAPPLTPVPKPHYEHSDTAGHSNRMDYHRCIAITESCDL